jgi:hypothetical protein
MATWSEALAQFLAGGDAGEGLGHGVPEVNPRTYVGMVGGEPRDLLPGDPLPIFVFTFG